MIRCWLLLMTFAIATAIEGFEPGLRAKFGTGPDAGESNLFNIPRTEENAKALGWECTERPPGPLPQLVMYCPTDKVVCCLYDDTGYIAGVQVAISKSEFSENVFDWKIRGFTSWNTTVNQKCNEFWTQQVYFVDSKYLAICKENRIASRDCSHTLQAGAIWVTSFDRNLRKISNKEEDIVSEQLFTKQGCLDGMGQHYFYNISTQTECKSNQIDSWFVITAKGELSAAAFLTFGKLQKPITRNWFERATLDIVKAIVPYGPSCLYAVAVDPGALTLHLFFVDKPWTITCPT